MDDSTADELTEQMKWCYGCKGTCVDPDGDACVVCDASDCKLVNKVNVVEPIHEVITKPEPELVPSPKVDERSVFSSADSEPTMSLSSSIDSVQIQSADLWHGAKLFYEGAAALGMDRTDASVRHSWYEGIRKSTRRISEDDAHVMDDLGNFVVSCSNTLSKLAEECQRQRAMREGINAGLAEMSDSMRDCELIPDASNRQHCRPKTTHARLARDDFDRTICYGCSMKGCQCPILPPKLNTEK